MSRMSRINDDCWRHATQGDEVPLPVQPQQARLGWWHMPSGI